MTRVMIGKRRSGFVCSKLTTSLVNVSLKFQTLISQIWQYFVEINVRSSHFFNKNIILYLVIKS